MPEQDTFSFEKKCITEVTSSSLEASSYHMAHVGKQYQN
jgi:hypothetical protein